jgi:hypothetical protein
MSQAGQCHWVRPRKQLSDGLLLGESLGSEPISKWRIKARHRCQSVCPEIGLS